MFFLFFILCAFNQNNGANGNAVVIVENNHDDKELVLAYVIHRHGERMPDDDELTFSTEQEKFQTYVKLYGLEGLTNIGKQRAYQLGKFIRHRYGRQGLKLISSNYVPDEISVRSTDKDRSKMTALVALSAIYPPGIDQQWDQGLGKIWQPIPYTTVPLSEDYIRFYSNCPKYIDLMAKAKKDSIDEEFGPYKDLFKKVEGITGRNFTENPLLFESVVDLVKSSKSLGINSPEWAEALDSRLQEAAILAYKLYFRNPEMKKIGGGVLLNEFLSLATDLAEGRPVTKRLRLFSAHDFNLGAMMEVTGFLKEYSIPDYTSVFALELYKLKKSGEYGVMGVYLNQAGNSAPETYRFSGCETSEYCKLETFKNLTKQYLLPEKDYYQLCNIKTEQ